MRLQHQLLSVAVHGVRTSNESTRGRWLLDVNWSTGARAKQQYEAVYTSSIYRIAGTFRGGLIFTVFAVD